MPIPAAQYLRVSTEHQQYSIENQAATIENYAESHGFVVVRTYSDAAKSGVVLKNRSGLRQLLHDVVGGESGFQAVLVYDVSRWGRFQDTDEAAHYEFLCKSAGVPIHYCAEPFANDGTLPSLILKTLKRTMAAEYSRELGVKVLAGQRRLASLGFKQGGMPGYGLRRMLVSSDGVPKQLLRAGERKSIATDRVILVPGPAEEVRVVREVYRMLIADRRAVYWIACELNRAGVPYQETSKWDYTAVCSILTHPKYAGSHVFGRTSRKLNTPTIRSPKSEWTVTPGAFEPIVDQATFNQAQRILEERTIRKPNKELLDGLRSLLAAEGRLSLALIQGSSTLPSPTTYKNRFGGLRQAYELIGYGSSRDFDPINLRRRTQALRDELIATIVAQLPDQVRVLRRSGRWRTRLQLRTGRHVSVLIARTIRPWKETICWQIDPIPRERRIVTLLGRLDPANAAFQDFYVFPNMDRGRRFHIRLHDEWLKRGLHLNQLSDLGSAVQLVCGLSAGKDGR